MTAFAAVRFAGVVLGYRRVPVLCNPETSAAAMRPVPAFEFVPVNKCEPRGSVAEASRGSLTTGG
jgi:hypothetical protein